LALGLSFVSCRVEDEANENTATSDNPIVTIEDIAGKT